jgi:hypothetical protein
VLLTSPVSMRRGGVRSSFRPASAAEVVGAECRDLRITCTVVTARAHRGPSRPYAVRTQQGPPSACSPSGQDGTVASYLLSRNSLKALNNFIVAS